MPYSYVWCVSLFHHLMLQLMLANMLMNLISPENRLNMLGYIFLTDCILSISIVLVTVSRKSRKIPKKDVLHGFMVIEFGTIRMGIYDFLSVNHGD